MCSCWLLSEGVLGSGSIHLKDPYLEFSLTIKYNVDLGYFYEFLRIHKIFRVVSLILINISPSDIIQIMLLLDRKFQNGQTL